VCRKPWAFAVPAGVRTVAPVIVPAIVAIIVPIMAAILLAIPTALALAGCDTRPQRAEAKDAKSDPPPQQRGPASTHTVSVTFDYDFKKNPPCSLKEAPKACVKEFNVYDISGGRYKLFSIPVPAGATGLLKGIAGKSAPRLLEEGTHFIAVTAENAAGVESDVNDARVSVQVKPKSPPDAGAAPSH
jgi:hypothetical protein